MPHLYGKSRGGHRNSPSRPMTPRSEASPPECGSPPESKRGSDHQGTIDRNRSCRELLTTTPKWSGGVPSSGTFNAGEAPARVLNVLGFEFDAQVVPT